MSRNRELMEHMEHTEHTRYEEAFTDGIWVACDLLRVGATEDENAQALPGNEPLDLDAHHQHLRELRLCMGIDAAASGDDNDQQQRS